MSTMVPQTTNLSTSVRDRADTAMLRLQARLRSTRQTLITQRLGIIATLIFILVAICVAASATLDLFLELDSVWRTLWMISVGGLCAVAASIGWKRWIANCNLSKVAVDAERQLTQFGQRLRTTVDYERQTPRPAMASPSLLNSLQQETATLAEQTDWNDAVDRRPLLIALASAFVVISGWMWTLTAQPEFRIAAARAMLIPLEYSTVTYTPESSTIRPGESITVEAQVSGRGIKTAILRFRPAGSNGEWTSLDLNRAERKESDNAQTSNKPSRLHGQLTAILSELAADTEFEIVAGPRPLTLGFVRVLQPLVLNRIESQVTPPTYTGRPVETAEKLDLSILEGSNVEFHLQFNRPITEATVVRVRQETEAATSGQDPVVSEIPLEISESFAHGHFQDLRQTASYTLSAKTADGMSLEPVTFSIRVQPDQPPHVTFIEPPEELVVTPTTEVPMIVEAADDLGLLKVGVLYQVGSGPMQTLAEEIPTESSESLRISPVLMLENHQLTFQEAVTYYAFAEDNYFGHPRRTTTPLRFIDIRPYKLSFQVVNSPGDCKSPGSSVTLEELITRQRQGLSQAFLAGQNQHASKEIAVRLSESQEQVQEATFELATGLAERGIEIPLLHQAVKSMGAAIDALDATNFPDAISSEQQALAFLISARENLRKKLNQADSQCASACKKFDREQRQKLRMPEKKKTDKQQQVAQARQKLEDLAKRERKWSEEAKQCCNSQSQSSSKSGSKPSQSSSSPSQSSAESQPPEQQQEGEKRDNPSPSDVAAKQEQLKSELAELQKEIEKLDTAGKAAGEQARQAAESMQQSLVELQKADGEAAAKEGERSANQLEQLSAHLAAMNARDFGQRLDEAQKLAQQLADRQGALEEKLRQQNEGKISSGASTPKSGDQPSQDGNGEGTPKPGSGGQLRKEGHSSDQGGSHPSSADLARDQLGLSAQTDLLADLLDRLKQDSITETGLVKQALDRADSKDPPREIAAGIRRTAEDLQTERKTAAAKGASAAKEGLQALSKSLATARGEYAQPQLKELMALEEQLAQLQEQIMRPQNQGQDSKLATGQKWQQLEPRLDKLASADKLLADALQKLREGPPSKSPSKESGDTPGDGGQKTPTDSTVNGQSPPKPDSKLKATNFQPNGEQEVPEGFYFWLELGDSAGVREISKAVQTRIQEAILAGALLDADQPVPPAYKDLVEKYYRALSDDLR
jgi:hypothetical protein